MKNNTKFFKPLLLLTLVVTMLFSNSITAKAIGKKISYDDYRAENKCSLPDKKNNVTVSADGQSLVVAKPVIELWQAEGVIVQYQIDFTLGDNKDETLNYELEFEVYNLKNDKLLGRRIVYDTPEHVYMGGTRDGNGQYLLYKAVNPKTSKTVSDQLKRDKYDEVVTPYYIRMRAKATDTVTGLTGTSKWSNNIYYIEDQAEPALMKSTKKALKVWVSKTKIKGCKVTGYNAYVCVNPRGKGKNTYYKFQMKNKDYIKTVTKLGKHKVNLSKNTYTVTIVPKFKHKGKIRTSEAYVLNSDTSGRR